MSFKKSSIRTVALVGVVAFCALLPFQMASADVKPEDAGSSGFEPGISKFDVASFQRLTKFRVGIGEEKYFYTFGEVRAQPGGEVLFEYEGIETCRQDPGSATATSVTQVSRRIFFYRDVKTGEYIRNFENSPVAPVSYPYLIMNWSLDEQGKVQIKGTQGQEPRVVSLNIEVPTLRRLPNDVLHFPVNLFFQAGPYFFHELGNYISEPNRSGTDSFESGHFVRLQPTPAWAAKRVSAPQVLLDLSVVNVKSFAELPVRLRKIISEEFPLYAKPPKNLEECLRIQQGQG